MFLCECMKYAYVTSQFSALLILAINGTYSIYIEGYDSRSRSRSRSGHICDGRVLKARY